jgi:tetratricopeptide (TPR) repeat protein
LLIGLLAATGLAAASLTDAPAQDSKWLPGYAIRYLVRIQDEAAALLTRQTVQVSIPTGGWLKPDASDIRVVSEFHKEVPAVVVSHDPRGDTVLQFSRRGTNRWYWVYAVNPKAPPQVDNAMQARMKQAREAGQRETLKTMTVRSESAKAAGELRDAQARVKREQETLTKVENELKQVPAFIADRAKEVAEGQAVLAPLTPRVAAAKAAHADAEVKAKAAKAVIDAAAGKPEALTAAEAAGLPVRMALAGAKTKLDAEESAHQQALAKVNQAKDRLDKGNAQLAAAQKLKQETLKAIAEVTPQVAQLTLKSEQLTGQANASAALSEKLQTEYRQLSLDADPRLHLEGLSLEVRDWGGDQLDELNDWATVVAGLQRSDNVLGNALITDVLQKMNPFRLGNNLNFAASYRGFLDIKTAGLYRFVLNADDAAFLFINDYLVYSRVGSNPPMAGRMEQFSVGADIELGVGVYPFEIHQVTGNTPGAIGRCAFYWFTPGAKNWARVPSSAFKPALGAIAIRAEAPNGVRVPIPGMGVVSSLNCSGSDLFLARFEAGGAVPGQKVSWDFGDGQKAVGATIEHLYFAPGDHEVGMIAHPGLPPFKRRFHVWPAPVATSPLALGDAVRALGKIDLNQLDVPRLAMAFAFLSQCGQTERWPLVEAVAVRLLREPLQDLQYRVQLMTALMEALARQGRSADALIVGQKAIVEAKAVRSLMIDVQMKLAEIHHRHRQDYEEAGRLYAEIVEKHKRLSLDSVRLAAIAWGDMYLSMGDTTRAASTYRLADGLGRGQGQLASVSDASRRGGLLRTAEKLLREGNIRQSVQILERIELEYPEQKVEGLFRFLRAESDRHAGYYAEAIGHYEVLLQMQQWAGYHSQAMQGLADACYRSDDFAGALKWLDLIKGSDAPFYEARKLADFQNVVLAGQAAQQAGLLAAAKNDYVLPLDQVVWGSGVPAYLLLGAPALATNAITFPRVAPLPATATFYDVPHLVSEGAYWLEFWFSNSFADSHAIPIPGIEVAWADTPGTPERVPVIRTFGLNFMGAVKIKAPVAEKGRLSLTFVDWQGVQRIHGLRLRPITARQEEALLNFMEGRDTP